MAQDMTSPTQGTRSRCITTVELGNKLVALGKAMQEAHATISELSSLAFACGLRLNFSISQSDESHAACAHEWKRTPEGGAWCSKCRCYADWWYCHKSPDHLCHYDKGDNDACDYCGHPEERK